MRKSTVVKILAIIILIIVISVGFVLLKDSDETGIGKISVVPRNESSYLDSDGDGVPDWEEILWGLDPNSKDTGGIGVLDSKKILELKASSKDSVGIKPVGVPPEEPFGDELGKSLLTSLVTLQRSGELTEENLLKLQNNVGYELFKSLREYNEKNLYNTEDLMRVENSEKNIINYIKTVNDLHKKHAAKAEDFDLIVDVFKDETKTNEKTVLYQKYSALVDSLALISVPIVFTEIHLDLINSLSRIERLLSPENDDALLKVVESIQYNSIVQEIIGIYEKIQNFVSVFS